MSVDKNFTNGNRLLYIILFMSLGVGSFSTYNTLGNSGQIDKLIDNLDEVLQREMRLLSAPIDERAHANTEMIAELRGRINDLEQKVAVLEERTRP